MLSHVPIPAPGVSWWFGPVLTSTSPAFILWASSKPSPAGLQALLPEEAPSSSCSCSCVVSVCLRGAGFYMTLVSEWWRPENTRDWTWDCISARDVWHWDFIATLRALSCGAVVFNYLHSALLRPEYALLIRDSCADANLKSFSSHWAVPALLWCPQRPSMKRQVWLGVSARLQQTGRGCCVPRTSGPRLCFLVRDLLAGGGPLAHPQANGCSCETTERALWQWGQLWRDSSTQCLLVFIYIQ